MRHTKGEWYYKDGAIYPVETGITLAHVYPSDNQQIDGELMAAAPELLEELIKAKELILVLAPELNFERDRWWNEHVRPIEDLIHKLL